MTAWPWVVLRICCTVTAVLVFDQAVFAGQFLAGSFGALHTHRENATVAGIAVLVSGGAAVLVRLRSGGPRWPAYACLGLFALIAIQIAMGFARLLAIHVPLGVTIIFLTLLLTGWSWRAAPGARDSAPRPSTRMDGAPDCPTPADPAPQHPKPAEPAPQHPTPVGPPAQHSTRVGPPAQHPTPAGPASERSTPIGPAPRHSTPAGPASERSTPIGPAPRHSTPVARAPQHPTRVGPAGASAPDAVAES